MEDAGAVRRGYFVESLEGAQFAWPGAIDRLREAPRGQRRERVDVLAAVDPACAWGSALPWPELARSGCQARRAASARRVVLVDGALALWVEPQGKRIATADALPAETIELALAVGAAAARGEAAPARAADRDDRWPAGGSSPWAAVSLAAGARVDYRGLVVRGAVATTNAEPEPEPDADPDAEDDDA